MPATDRPGVLLRWVLPGVFLLSSVGLGVLALGPRSGTIALMDVAPLMGLAALLLVPASWMAIGFSAVRHPTERRRLLDEALLAACVFAPLAALAPWSVTPTHFGIGFGGLPFFVSWLTRYPTVAGFNHEVALGIGAMLGACAVPAFFAMAATARGRVSPVLAGVFLALQLIAYVPVLVRLDFEMLCMAAMWGSADSLGELWGAAAFFGGGALVRASATVSMGLVFLRSLRRTRRPVVWEMG